MVQFTVWAAGEEKELVSAYGSRERKRSIRREGMACLEEMANCTHMQEAEKASRKWGKTADLHSPPQRCTSCNKFAPTKDSITALTEPPTREQVFKYMSPWGHCTSKPPHPSKSSKWLSLRQWSVTFFLLFSLFNTKHSPASLRWQTMTKSASKLEFICWTSPSLSFLVSPRRYSTPSGGVSLPPLLWILQVAHPLESREPSSSQPVGRGPFSKPLSTKM